MPLIVAVAVSVLLVALAAIMTAEETAFALIAPGRAVRLAEAGRKGATALESLGAVPHRLRAAAALTRGIAYVGGTVCIGWVFEHYTEFTPLPAALIGGAIGLVVAFSLAEALPRTVAVQNPEDVSLTFAVFALRATGVLYAPAKLLGALWTWGMRLAVGVEAARSPWIAEDDYRALSDDDEQSARDETEEALLEAVSEFAEKIVREVMVPRTDMISLPDTATAREAIEAIEAHGYSRLPIYHETLDDILGVLYAKDLLAAYSRDTDVRPVSIARRAFFVPETKPVSELLLEMQTRTHIAIVADEYGGTAGLVTIEDLLEEIVGEIFDEYDLEETLVHELEGGRFAVDAKLSVDDLNERFGTAIESDSDTVGGAVIEAVGRIPEPGDSVEVEGLRFVVEELEGTRIRRLVVEPAGQRDTKEGQDA